MSSSGKYWECEVPTVADTGKNILRYFKDAGKLQVSMPNWTDANGETKPGKAVTLDLAALRATPEALEMFRVIGGDAE
jgi:hypothetical protein